MKLYVNEDKTKWAGTQADAKKELGQFEGFDVPVDKSGLLEFLNNFGLTPQTQVIDEERPVQRNEYHNSDQRPPSDTLVGRCNMVDLKELSTMLNILLNRTWNGMDRLEEES